MFHPAISEESIVNRLNKGVCSLVVFGINLSHIFNFPLSEESVEKIVWGWLDLFVVFFSLVFLLNNKKISCMQHSASSCSTRDQDLPACIHLVCCQSCLTLFLYCNCSSDEKVLVCSATFTLISLL